MQQIELELAGGGVLTVSLRASLDAMPAVKQRPLVLVVPGGGYNHVSPREGDPVALQFAAAGYHTAVLTYSVGEGAQNYQPLRQLNEALALLRQNAGEWHILPDKIAVCGFSAGGHLALSGAVLDIPGETAQQRPNAVILGYPVITAGEFAHRGSFVQLAGSEDAAAQQAFTLEDKVTSTHRRSSSGIPWRIRPFRWRTRFSCWPPCGGRTCRARRICSRRALTAPASVPPKWMPPTLTAPIGWLSASSGWGRRLDSN